MISFKELMDNYRRLALKYHEVMQHGSQFVECQAWPCNVPSVNDKKDIVRLLYYPEEKAND